MSDEMVTAFLRKIGTGRIDEVRALLAATPQLLNAVGPHPFWGGRPQALHVAIETKRRDMFDLLLEADADVNGSNEPTAPRRIGSHGCTARLGPDGSCGIWTPYDRRVVAPARR
jgi:hypothetical protein